MYFLQLYQFSKWVLNLCFFQIVNFQRQLHIKPIGPKTRWAFNVNIRSNTQQFNVRPNTQAVMLPGFRQLTMLWNIEILRDKANIYTLFSICSYTLRKLSLVAIFEFYSKFTCSNETRNQLFELKQESNLSWLEHPLISKRRSYS